MSFAPLRSSTPGLVPSAASMHEGQLFVNSADRLIYMKTGTDVKTLASDISTSSNGTFSSEFPGGLKIAYGPVNLNYLSDTILFTKVTFQTTFFNIPSVTLTVNTDITSNAPTNNPLSYSVRVNPTTTSCDLIAHRLDGDPLSPGFSVRAYFQAIGI